MIDIIRYYRSKCLPRLSLNEEIELIKYVKENPNDKKALDKLMRCAILPFLIPTTIQLNSMSLNIGVPLEDLFHTGIETCLRLLPQFNPEYKVRLYSYVIGRIRGRQYRLLLNGDTIIRRVKKTQLKYRWIDLYQNSKSGIKNQDGEKQLPLIEKLGNWNTYPELEKRNIKEQLDSFYELLNSPIDQYIFQARRYGLSFTEMSNKLKVTHQSVSDRWKRMLDILRERKPVSGRRRKKVEYFSTSKFAKRYEKSYKKAKEELLKLNEIYSSKDI